MIDTTVQEGARRRRALVIVKVAHTAIWAFFAGCILSLPVVGWLRRFDWALGMTAFILIECLVLAVNQARCPLTAIAARYTADRSPAFDIYLPEWLAAHNKEIFGTLFVLNELVVFRLWRH